MAFFKDIATPLIRLGIPVVPLRAHTKQAFLSDWPSKATTDSAQVETWDREYPDANVACVAKAHPGGVWFFELDRPEVIQRVQSDTGKLLFNIPTLKVRSRPGRGHFYFRQSTRSIEMGNISQDFVTGTDWSARVDNQYVVGPGSWHPDSGQQYHIFEGSPLELIKAPDWLIDWLISQKTVETVDEPEARTDQSPFVYTEQEKKEFKITDVSREGSKIPRGAHDNTLTRIAGKLHWLHPDWTEPELGVELAAICEARCEGYGNDYQEMCEKIAHSIGKRPVKVDVFKQNADAQAEQIKLVQEIEQNDEPEIETSSVVTRPVFPTWVMQGTSLWDGLVGPVEKTSDKYPELVFMPAVLMYLNYLGNKVTVKNRSFVPSLFLGIISPYGKFYKSTSCEIAQQYFRVMNLAVNHHQKLTSADGQTVIISPGSTEGLGLELSRAQARNAVIFFDELGRFIRKANIEHSTFTEDMLSFYEARWFSNVIKARKDNFTFDSSSYCFSWMWCTTDRKFPTLWSKLPGDSSGLNDRMFFLITPEEPRKARFHDQLDHFSLEGLQRTKDLISAAITRKEYEYHEDSEVDKFFDGLEAREQTLTERLALYFAVDSGHGKIRYEDIEKAKALVLYGRATLAYLAPVEAETYDGRLAKVIVREVQHSGGKIGYRDLYRKLDGLGQGRLWGQVFKTLCDQNILTYRGEIRGGPSHRPAMVYLLKESL
jgi:hypothetical protein